jgi:hypothetical protein
MQVDTMTDGSFRFTFPKTEKRLGIQLLSVITCTDEDTKEQIEYAKYRILLAGVLTDKPTTEPPS